MTMYDVINEFQNLAEIVADDDNPQWRDPGKQVPKDNFWSRSKIAPRAGTARLVRANNSQPPLSRVGEERWIMFRPGLAAENGWVDYPATIPASSFVRCRLLAFMDGAASSGRWLRVAISEVVPISELERRFRATQRQKLETRRLLTGYLTCWQDWEFWEASDEYSGYWLLARRQADHAHVVAVGEGVWIPGDYYHWAWGGHVVLPISEWRRICTRTV